MSKQVLDVGNCGPDHMALKAFLTSHFDCEVRRAHGMADSLEELRGGGYGLVLVNRKLDRDYSDGIEVIRAIKADGRLAHLPAMLLSNYPEHQDEAVAIGAERGFGKLEYNDPEARERLAKFLGG